MKDEMFNELFASVQEMDEIAQGIKVAARVTVFLELGVKQFHENNWVESKSTPDRLAQVD